MKSPTEILGTVPIATACDISVYPAQKGCFSFPFGLTHNELFQKS